MTTVEQPHNQEGYKYPESYFVASIAFAVRWTEIENGRTWPHVSVKDLEITLRTKTPLFMRVTGFMPDAKGLPHTAIKQWLNFIDLKSLLTHSHPIALAQTLYRRYTTLAIARTRTVEPVSEEVDIEDPQFFELEALSPTQLQIHFSPKVADPLNPALVPNRRQELRELLVNHYNSLAPEIRNRVKVQGLSWLYNLNRYRATFDATGYSSYLHNARSLSRQELEEELPWNSLFGQFASYSEKSQKRAATFIDAVKNSKSIEELIACFPLQPQMPQTKLIDLINELI